MKRILAYLLSISLILLPMPPMVQAEETQVVVASGTIAAADIAVTLTDGSADVDLSSATIPRNYKGHLLRIYDANNVMIQGFVYTDGAGTVQNIVSTKGGTTRNWNSQGAGFDDTTNCRYEIWKLLTLPVIATQAIAEGAALIDSTTANAFYGGADLDCTNYQDGRHLAHFTDSSGQVAVAWISATAPSGEATTDRVTNGAFTTDTGWTKHGGATVDAGDSNVAAFTGAPDAIRQVLSGYTGAIGKLIKITGNYTQTTGNLTHTGFLNVQTPFSTFTLASATGAFTVYRTTSTSGTSTEVGQVIGTLDNYAWYEVTMPVATGALLLSAKGGSRGWMYKSATWDANKAQTLRILYAGD